uniref:B box-type domain-containing protein n=1 Tax=Nelumbo nucifera TaxID=4432 RepID=A0A822YHY8_NELNU|nr:TPA_asm: hypothetical protein HUJ06_011041 [Nelumbo nucifera]
MAIDDESGKGYPASWSLSAKPCDSCKSYLALLFCWADSAFLCFNCDAKVHGTNKLASQHDWVWMCETDTTALCVTCDGDIHSANPLARRHERIPVVPFYESAASAMKSNEANLLVPDGLVKSSDDDDDRNDKEEDNDTCHEEAKAASWLLPNPNPAKLMETPDLKSGDYFFSDVDPCLDLDYGSPMETRMDNRHRGLSSYDRKPRVDERHKECHSVLRRATRWESDNSRERRHSCTGRTAETD